MELTSKKASLESFLAIYDFHSRLFRNVLDGISEEDAQNRLDTKANHMAWLAGSLVCERFAIANAIGIDARQTSEEFFVNHKGIQDGIRYPSLDEFRSDWATITPILKDALGNLTEKALEGPDPFEMPGGDYTFFDSFTFCLDRESYCIGQLGLWRRLHGYPAMRYD